MKTITGIALDTIITAYTASPSQEAALQAMQELQTSASPITVVLKTDHVDILEQYLSFIGTLSVHLDTASKLSLISLLQNTYVQSEKNVEGSTSLLSQVIVSDSPKLLNDYITRVHLFLVDQDVVIMTNAINSLLLWMSALNASSVELCEETSARLVVDAIVGGGEYYSYDNEASAENAKKMASIRSAIAAYAVTVIDLSKKINVYQENEQACAAVKKLWMADDVLSLFEDHHIKNDDFFELLDKNFFSIIGAKDKFKEIIKAYPNIKDQLLAYVLQRVDNEPDTTKKITLLKTALDPKTDLGCIFWCQRRWISKPSAEKGTLLKLRQKWASIDPPESIAHHTSTASVSKSHASLWKKRSVSARKPTAKTTEDIEMQTFTS